MPPEARGGGGRDEQRKSHAPPPPRGLSRFCPAPFEGKRAHALLTVRAAGHATGLAVAQELRMRQLHPSPPPCCVIPFWRFCGHGVLPAPWRVPHPLAEGREGGRRGEERRGEERRRNPPAATAAAAATSGKEGGRRVGGIKSERSGEYAQPREAHAACMRLDLWIESPWYKLQSVSSRPAVAV